MSRKNKNFPDLPSLINPESNNESPSSYLLREFTYWESLIQTQPVLIQRFLETQGQLLAEAISESASQVTFSLPSQVKTTFDQKDETAVPKNLRDQWVGGLMSRLTRTNLNQALRQRLDELEASTNPAVVVAGGLIRFITATTLVHVLLPAGRSVMYQVAEGDEIPTIPVVTDHEVASAITATTDAIVEREETSEETTGELLVPYVPAARRFFLPQWIALDDQDQLLVNSITEAEADLASMQRFVKVLHHAVALAPYMVTDEVYTQKRYGMLGQLINQGRAIARHETREIIKTIKKRASANDLNRGLSISLPYFDDQSLEMKTHSIDIIPAGRIMFVPGFVVLATRKEQAKVAQDTRLDRATRKHLLLELQMLEEAFLPEMN